MYQRWLSNIGNLNEHVFVFRSYSSVLFCLIVSLEIVVDVAAVVVVFSSNWSSSTS